MNSNLGKEKFFIIYQITNLINGKIYVGAHTTYNINDKYMGSSKYLKKDIKEFGRENFKKIPLHVFDNKEDMIKMEAKLVNKEFCHRQDTYNKMIGGITDFSWLGTITVKDKFGNNFQVYKDDPRYLSGELVFIWVGKKHPNHLEGNTQSDETKEKIRIKALNRTASKDTKSKMSEQRKGEKNYTYGTCWINKNGENKLIKKEDFEKFIFDGWIKGSKLGKQSEEHKRKLSEARKGKKHKSHKKLMGV